MINESTLKKKSFFTKINYFLIIFLPVSLMIGSLINNIITILICLVFIFDLIQRKDNFFFKDINFYFLIFIYFYLILNSLFVSENNIESLTRAIGFIRFIFLAYAIFYYFVFFKDKIIKYWFIIFITVSFDVIYEYIFGKNILGFYSTYPGRIASFTGDELKIGGFYFGFFGLMLLYVFKYSKISFYLLSITFLIISALIGEKSNFIKNCLILVFIYYFFLDKEEMKKFFLIFILGIFITLSVNMNNNLRSSFLGDLPLIKQTIAIMNTVSPNLVSDKKFEYEKTFKEHIYSMRHYAHYITAFEIFKKNYLFGTGLKNFRYESYKEEYKLGGLIGGSTHPHQVHFEILSELGLIGYILFLSNIIFNLFRQRQNPNNLKFVAISFILSTFIPFLPSGSFFTSYGATIFFINYSFLIFHKTR
jgi:O-antigen ligase